ncbi:MAG: Nif3-like dinuclear metal center hexameric protein [Bacillota bacterium]
MTTNGVTTEELMQIALDLVKFGEVPGDSGVYVPGKGIRRILAAIDVDVAELRLAKDLGYDCFLAHHPNPATLSYPEVLDKQVDLMVKAGVAPAAAQKAVAALKEGAAFRYHSGNYDHLVSFARLLGLPFLNIHNPLDELGRRRMQAAIDGHLRADSKVSDVVAALLTIPEIAAAPTRPEVRVGAPDDRAGRVVVAHGAGTNGGYEVAKAYFEAGVDTVVYIHVDYGVAQRLRADGRGHLVVAGHIAADAAGIDPYLDALEAKGLEVTRLSGLGLAKRR